nr:putative reverse transcriptase domain-containing protein [Tanacetum cinerariifolium]
MIVGAHLIGRIARSYRLMTGANLRNVTIGKGATLLNIVKLVEMGICRYNGLGRGELVDDTLDNYEEEVAADEGRRAQDDEGCMRRHPNMSFTNRLRVMDDRLGDFDTNIYKLSNDVEELTTVVCLAGYYRRFIKGFSKIAKPLTKLTQINMKFDWEEKEESSFPLLKHKLRSAPILAFLEGTNNFVVYCDASHKGLCVVLMQKEK